MKKEIYIIKVNEINEIYNEIKISNKILNIENYNLYFQPILNYKNIDTFKSFEKTLNNKKNIIIEKESKILSSILPLTYKNDILEYLNETIKILLSNNIYISINNKNLEFDIINKIPIIINFKNAIIITIWQNKINYIEKYNEDINKLIFIT